MSGSVNHMIDAAMTELLGRSGFDDIWYNLDEETRTEILQDMVKAAKSVAQTWKYCPDCGYNLNNPLYVYK